jgi:hypothetical protein
LGRLSRLERKADFLSIIAIPAGAFVAAWLFYQIAVLFEWNTQTALILLILKKSHSPTPRKNVTAPAYESGIATTAAYVNRGLRAAQVGAF